MAVISVVQTTPIALVQGATVLVTTTGQVQTYGVTISNLTVDLTGFGAYNLAVTVLGAVSSTNDNAINLHFYPVESASNDTVVIGTTGIVTSSFYYAAIVMGGQGNVFSNAGIVLGGVGVWGAGWTGGHFDNAGNITGVRFAAVHLEAGSDTTMTNTGVIRGVAGVELIASTGRIHNAGQILSTTEDRAAVDGALASAAFTVRNLGEISGPGSAILGSDFGDVVRSSGFVSGLVNLGAGADLFYGRAGVVDARISGGVGNDLVRSGRVTTRWPVVAAMTRCRAMRATTVWPGARGRMCSCSAVAAATMWCRIFRTASTRWTCGRFIWPILPQCPVCCVAMWVGLSLTFRRRWAARSSLPV